MMVHLASLEYIPDIPFRAILDCLGFQALRSLRSTSKRLCLRVSHRCFIRLYLNSSDDFLDDQHFYSSQLNVALNFSPSFSNEGDMALVDFELWTMKFADRIVALENLDSQLIRYITDYDLNFPQVDTLKCRSEFVDLTESYKMFSLMSMFGDGLRELHLCNINMKNFKTISFDLPLLNKLVIANQEGIRCSGLFSLLSVCAKSLSDLRIKYEEELYFSAGNFTGMKLYKLRKISIYMQFGMAVRNLELLLTACCSSLTFLSLQNCCIGKLSTLEHDLVALKILEIVNCSGTKEALCQLFYKAPNLKSLYLHDVKFVKLASSGNMSTVFQNFLCDIGGMDQNFSACLMKALPVSLQVFVLNQINVPEVGEALPGLPRLKVMSVQKTVQMQGLTQLLTQSAGTLKALTLVGGHPDIQTELEFPPEAGFPQLLGLCLKDIKLINVGKLITFSRDSLQIIALCQANRGIHRIINTNLSALKCLRLSREYQKRWKSLNSELIEKITHEEEWKDSHIWEISGRNYLKSLNFL